jgi:hypothetical protein
MLDENRWRRMAGASRLVAEVRRYWIARSTSPFSLPLRARAIGAPGALTAHQLLDRHVVRGAVGGLSTRGEQLTHLVVVLVGQHEPPRAAVHRVSLTTSTSPFVSELFLGCPC